MTVAELRNALKGKSGKLEVVLECESGEYHKPDLVQSVQIRVYDPPRGDRAGVGDCAASDDNLATEFLSIGWA